MDNYRSIQQLVALEHSELDKERYALQIPPLMRSQCYNRLLRKLPIDQQFVGDAERKTRAHSNLHEDPTTESTHKLRSIESFARKSNGSLPTAPSDQELLDSVSEHNKELRSVIVVPARIGSSRLPQKLLKTIGDKTVIEHVIYSLSRGGISPCIIGSGEADFVMPSTIIVATDDDRIANLSKKAGAITVMTSPDCASGSDRVYEAISKLNLHSMDYVINVQGDMPFVDPVVILRLIESLRNSDCDIVTAYVKISKDVAMAPSNVKVVKDNNDMALYFSRSLVPYGAEEFLYHVGIYGYRLDSLKRFVNLNYGQYELSEKLEQLRALENGMRIKLVESDQIPISIDTQEDLDKARKHYINIMKYSEKI